MSRVLISDNLESAGLDLLRHAGIELDERYGLTGAALQDALRASKAGVLVWSTATRDSKWVSREYQVMERLTDAKPSFRFVPVKLDSSEVPEFAENRIFPPIWRFISSRARCCSTPIYRWA